MKVTKSTEVVLDGEEYLLEEGDDIVVNEGMISRALLAMLNKVIPLDLLKKMDPAAQNLFANLIQDPEKAKLLRSKIKDDPSILDIFAR
jgi:hypothetical protein